MTNPRQFLICTTFYFVVRRKSVRLTMTVVRRMEGQRGVNFLHMSVSRGRMRGLFRDHDPESQFILFKPLFVILSSSGKSGQTFPVIKQHVSNNAFPMLVHRSIYYTHTLLHQGKIAQISTLIAYHFFLILHNFSVYYTAHSLPYFNVNNILKVLKESTAYWGTWAF